MIESTDIAQAQQPRYMDPTPVVFERNGEVYANSRDVAAYFEKEHRHVLDAIDNLIKAEPNLGLLKFRQTPYVEAQNGQTYRSYEIHRDGFTLLAMGFTGPKALRFKIRYIDRFNEMEASLRKSAPPIVDLNDPSSLRTLLLSYSDQNIELKKEVDQLRPSHEALERISEADGSFCITDAAKALQMRPKDLFAWLRQNGWIYRRSGSAHDLGYQSKTSSGLLEHKITTVLRGDGSEKVTEQVRITAKGMTRLAVLIKPAVRLIGEKQ
ncbi:Rha family phage regulatory protein [Mesorhizobium loti]|uniref:Rha family phage regulatory protein n=1 Tax=Rhizobium loti TaxID=381 RepID=A0A8E3B2X7_RHILI|nr:phage regulatory protein/antirepressor Ant [Mesorhizobium loti]PWJ88404.1 Rha family phage regulatory protein [Mesorhizobium loti]